MTTSRVQGDINFSYTPTTLGPTIAMCFVNNGQDKINFS